MHTGKTDLRSAHGAFAAHGIRALRGRYSGIARSRASPAWTSTVYGVAQLTFARLRTSRPVCVRRTKLYHMGIRRPGLRNTLANADATRIAIYADFAQRLMHRPQAVCERALGVDLANTAYALTRRTIDLSLSLFRGRRFRNHEGGGEDAHAARSARQ